MVKRPGCGGYLECPAVHPTHMRDINMNMISPFTTINAVYTECHDIMELKRVYITLYNEYN